MKITPTVLAAMRRPARRNKYKAVATIYNGVRYASKAEANHAAALDLEQTAGVVRLWIGQPKFRLGCPENVYVADMLVVYVDGRVEVHDVKGVRTSKFRRDAKLWSSYGPCPLRIIGLHAEVIPGRSP